MVNKILLSQEKIGFNWKHLVGKKCIMTSEDGIMRGYVYIGKTNEGHKYKLIENTIAI